MPQYLTLFHEDSTIGESIERACFSSDSDDFRAYKQYLSGILSIPPLMYISIRKSREKGKKLSIFDIVKGTVEDTDIDFYTTLQREIFEETNLVDAVIGKLFDLVVKIDNDIVNLLLVFEVILEENQSNIGNKNNIADESIKDYTWINKNDFLSMEADNFIDNRIYTVLLKFFSYQK